MSGSEQRRFLTGRHAAWWSVLVLVVAGLGLGVAPAAAADAAVSFTVQARTWVPAGTAFSVSVTARDSAGAVVPSYRGTVAITSDDPRAPVLPAAYTFTSADRGVRSLPGVVLHTAGTRTLSATDTVLPTLTGRSAPIHVSPGPLAALTVSAPYRAVAGIGFSVSVTAKDSWQNRVVSYRGSVRFGSDDARVRSLPSPYTFTSADQGTRTFPGVTLVSTGTHTVTATDVARPSATGTDAVAVANAQAGVEGQVLSGLDPLAGATVTVYDATTGQPLRSAKADIDGYRYRITGLPAGPVKIGAVAGGAYLPEFANDQPTFALAQVFTLVPGQVLTQGWGEPFGPYLDLAYMPAGVEGTVTGTAEPGAPQLPLEGVAIEVRSKTTGALAGTASTDAAGWFTVGDLVPNAYVVTGHKDGWNDFTVFVTLPRGFVSGIGVGMLPAGS
ncbi:carboxypeptidase regulatory-like domain-containing protein [Cellulomonas humilata]|uniref:Carboxypeptidase regulatory-like domain-containing protein n=1 Tax=Cellulomonas humilata TaxID=144055 RepID=A0A7Y6DXM6_9CELL|nr:carboxypeptidase-like regulatory domain-containing protein [Cellulomonas humilata]NUU17515.1 carboxypeptidase regulatory-like domain-containing protein [Cellulomonas humilata]